jgi:hypothetical protein
MALLTPAELAEMRADAVVAMSQTGFVLSSSGAGLNSAGGRSAGNSGWVAGPAVACRIWRQRDFAIEAPAAGQMESGARYKLSLPYGTAIDARCRFQLSGGSVYEVQGVDTDHADAIQVLCDVKLVS